MQKLPKHAYVLLISIVSVFLTSCGYFKMCAYRYKLKGTMNISPSQSVKKELDTESNSIIYGEINSVFPMKGIIAVVAISFKYGKQEIVASSFLCDKGYYSMLVPPGEYQLLTFLDINKDNVFTAHECVGYFWEKNDTTAHINIMSKKDQLFYKRADMLISSRMPINIERPIFLKLPSSFVCCPSKTYPAEVLRRLNDSLFSPDVATLGVYNTVHFSNLSGLYLYALSERDFSKTPVIFVHGYGGTPREFSFLVQTLDTTKYQPFFFYYPTGMDLHKSSQILYEIFFSGNIFHMNKPFVVIAHSMGGLVARAALNLYSTLSKSTYPVEFISLCTPYKGSDKASESLNSAPVIIESWRDIAAGSDFLQELYQTKLAKGIQFSLIFCYKSQGSLNKKEYSDGTISLSSQLFELAQQSATTVLGFNETHTSVLTSKSVADQIGIIMKRQ